MKLIVKMFLSLALLTFCLVCKANSEVTMYATQGNQAKSPSYGKIEFHNSPFGLLIIPHLADLPPGIHGFHIHVNPSCKNHGLAAGGHFDPNNTGKHLGPYNSHGHLGDLPALFVNKEGKADLPILAPRLTVNDLYGHAIMIHAGGDNYRDTPKKLGGGGTRIACGIVQKKALAKILK